MWIYRDEVAHIFLKVVIVNQNVWEIEKNILDIWRMK